MSNQAASWTVHDTRHAAGAIDDNLEALLKVVDEPDNDEMYARHEPFVARAGGGGYTKATQVFVSPSPLTPAEIGGTPVKDPMESFNAWARGQTPTSNRNSPTPTGGFMGVARQAPNTGNGAANRHLNMNGGVAGTPAKLGATPTRGPGLEAIQEHRRQLLQQMEELEMQELELRNRQNGNGYNNQSDSSNLFSVQSRQPFSQGLNPFAASFGAPTPSQPQMTAESIRGRVYETAKDQHGCRFLQRALDSNYDRDMAQVIMSEIVPYVPELMTDQYANFLVQKLFDMMPHDVRFSVAKVAAPQMPMIALTPHGTFSVQKLIETITTREEMLVVRDALSADVVRLVVDVHGNHVIQKVLQRFDHPDKQFIYDAVSTDCASIAMNKQGCCVLQRCLEYASPEQHKALVSTILDAALDVVEDPYGNYVVQYVLESDEVEINDRIGLMFLPAISRLAINKFSSNVMERVLRRTSQHVKDKYCEALCDLNTATRLLSDDYGNYVVQTALTTGSPQHVETLTQTIRPVLHTIRNAPYAKKLEAKMDMIGRKKFSPTGGGGRGGQSGYRNFPSASAMPFSPMGGPIPQHMGGGMERNMMPPMMDASVGPLTPYAQAPMQHRPSSNIPMMTAAQRTAIDAAMVDAIGGNGSQQPAMQGATGGGGNFANNGSYQSNGGAAGGGGGNNGSGAQYQQPSKYTATSQMMPSAPHSNASNIQGGPNSHNNSGNTYNSRFTDGNASGPAHAGGGYQQGPNQQGGNGGAGNNGQHNYSNGMNGSNNNYHGNGGNGRGANRGRRF